MANLKCRNSEVDIMILCETFLRDHAEHQVNISGYNLISNHQQHSNGSGTALLVHEGMIHKCRRDLDIFDEKIIESVFIETISKSGKKIIIGSIYRPPNVNPNLFITTVMELTSKLKLEQKSDIILGMDHNLDLLKLNTHRHTQHFYKIMLENNLLPTITQPTQITQSSANLIDNIFVSENLHRFSKSAILLEDISGHLPTIALLKQTRMTIKAPLTFESRNLSQSKLRQINHDLHQKDWISKLDSSDANDNFDTLMLNIHSVMDKYSPVKCIRISAKRQHVEPWMTKGLKTSFKKKKLLYRESLKVNATEQERLKYTQYRNRLNILKRIIKQNYYKTRATDFAKDSKKLWALINKVVGKRKSSGSIIPYITIIGIRTYTPRKIANEFAQFYSSLGQTLANKIKPSQESIQNYLSKIPMNTKSLVLNETNMKEIESLIKKLPNKTSSGHDSISNVMLKQLSNSISFPLMIIFNQSIAQGRFPDSMKKAEIIPLFKGKESDQVINYRPISLLITILKVLEKIMYKKLYKFINKHDILYQSQYGFRNKYSCEQAILELTGQILYARDKGLHAAALFLDLSKALDTLNHDVLLQKLYRYGVRGLCLDWFKDYLTNRSLVSKITMPGNVITRSKS